MVATANPVSNADTSAVTILHRHGHVRQQYRARICILITTQAVGHGGLLTIGD